jgi:signal transduction histidine kinase
MLGCGLVMETGASERVEAAILMVDDHPPNLVALRAVLGPIGADLVVANSGEEALERLEEREFALVLLDQRMPGLSGTETIAAIAERLLEPRPPILLLTAYTLDDAGVREAYRLGCVDILQKPYLGEVLRTKVRVFVELFRYRELLRRKLQEEERRERERFEQELVAMVSHELGSPLSVISLGASRLLNSATDPESKRGIVTRIAAAAARAIRLTQDLLTFTEARHGNRIPMHPKCADLHRVVHDTVESLRLEHGSQRIVIEREGSATGDFDEDRISQILTNLVSNAIRYGAREEPVLVRTLGTESALVLEVVNSGPPIPEDERARLFEPLQRGSGSHRLARGFGLGLFIVEQLVSAHHGKVEVESDEQRGTTFRVLLPRSRHPRPSADDPL